MKQNTLEWLESKMGVISASEACKAIAKKGTDTRHGYLCQKVAEIATGEMPELNARALEWGKENEAAARALYELETNTTVSEVGFFYGLNKRVGCSPDGIIEDLKKGVEIKCPFSSKVFIEVLTGKIKPEYLIQCQFSMWVTGFETWDFVNFDPRMKKKMLHIQTLERDQKCMDRFDIEIPEFIAEMDTLLEIAGFKFGDQWVSKKIFA